MKHRASWGRLLLIELEKSLRRPTAWIPFLVMAAFVGLSAYGLSRGQKSWLIRMLVRATGAEREEIVNASLLVRVCLEYSFWTLGALFAASAFAASLPREAQSGTLRAVLARPVGRVRLLLAKFVASWLYVALLFAFQGLVAAAVGLWVFGRGELLLFDMDRIRSMQLPTFAEDSALRLVQAYAVAVLSLGALGGIGTLVGTLVRSPNAATITTLALYFIAHALGSSPFFEPLRPYLFTRALVLFRGPLVPPPGLEEVGVHVRALSGYLGGGLVLAILAFRRREIR